MPYYSQVNSRLTRRLLTVLLLGLAAFGAGGAGFAVARFAQVVVCASNQERREPHQASEQRTSPLSPPRPIQRNISLPEHGPHDLFLGREFFQRPPPAVLSHA